MSERNMAAVGAATGGGRRGLIDFLVPTISGLAPVWPQRLTGGFFLVMGGVCLVAPRLTIGLSLQRVKLGTSQTVFDGCGVPGADKCVAVDSRASTSSVSATDAVGKEASHALVAQAGNCLPAGTTTEQVACDATTEALVVMTQCFGAQAMLCGTLLMTSRLDRRGYAVWGVAMLPFVAFDWWFYNSGFLTPFGAIGDAVGNAVFIACAAVGCGLLGDSM